MGYSKPLSLGQDDSGRAAIRVDQPAEHVNAFDGPIRTGHRRKPRLAGIGASRLMPRSGRAVLSCSKYLASTLRALQAARRFWSSTNNLCRPGWAGARQPSRRRDGGYTPAITNPVVPLCTSQRNPPQQCLQPDRPRLAPRWARAPEPGMRGALEVQVSQPSYPVAARCRSRPSRN
jgi:hypothetical protein